MIPAMVIYQPGAPPEPVAPVATADSSRSRQATEPPRCARADRRVSERLPTPPGPAGGHIAPHSHEDFATHLLAQSLDLQAETLQLLLTRDWAAVGSPTEHWPLQDLEAVLLLVTCTARRRPRSTMSAGSQELAQRALLDRYVLIEELLVNAVGWDRRSGRPEDPELIRVRTHCRRRIADLSQAAAPLGVDR